MHRSLAVALACAVVACGQKADVTPAGQPATHTAGGSVAPAGSEPEIARLRRLTADFHTFDKASAAGWKARLTPCFSDPSLGAMGYHYGNESLIDATVEADKPELLLYEPQKDGSLRFVAVEYAVPFTAWSSAPTATPPSLFGQSFHRNEEFKLWVLHVWHVQDNPRGMFADWNPGVSCQFAKP